MQISSCRTISVSIKILLDLENASYPSAEHELRVTFEGNARIGEEFRLQFELQSDGPRAAACGNPRGRAELIANSFADRIASTVVYRCNIRITCLKHEFGEFPSWLMPIRMAAANRIHLRIASAPHAHTLLKRSGAQAGPAASPIAPLAQHKTPRWCNPSFTLHIRRLCGFRNFSDSRASSVSTNISSTLIFPRMSLAGKIAVVAGSSRGIGRGIALQFAQAKASLVLLYNSDTVKAEEVRQFGPIYLGFNF